MNEKQDFIEYAKEGKILSHKCSNCGNLSLATVYFCKKCGKRGFEDLAVNGQGKVEIVQGIELNNFAQEKIKITTDELLSEKEAVKDLLD